MEKEAEATVMWYDEVENPGYNFSRGGYSSGTGHFTQVVWKSSTKLGCGYFDGWVSCRYCEVAGNMKGDFNDNVFPKSTPLPDGTKANPTDPVTPKKPSPSNSNPSSGGQNPEPQVPKTDNAAKTYKWNYDGTACTTRTTSQSRWGSSTRVRTSYGVSVCGDKPKPQIKNNLEDPFLTTVTQKRNSDGSCTTTIDQATIYGPESSTTTEQGAAICGDEPDPDVEWQNDNPGKLCYTEEMQGRRCLSHSSLGQQTTAETCAQTANSRDCETFNMSTDDRWPCDCCLDGFTYGPGLYSKPSTHGDETYTVYKVNKGGRGTCFANPNPQALLAQMSKVVESEDVVSQTSHVVQLTADDNDLISLVDTPQNESLLTVPTAKYDGSNTSTILLSLLAGLAAFTAYRKYNKKHLVNQENYTLA